MIFAPQKCHFKIKIFVLLNKQVTIPKTPENKANETRVKELMAEAREIMRNCEKYKAKNITQNAVNIPSISREKRSHSRPKEKVIYNVKQAEAILQFNKESEFKSLSGIWRMP